MCIILHRKDFFMLCSKCKVKPDKRRQHDFNI